MANAAALTLEQLERWPKATVSPRQICDLLGIDAYSLNVQAKSGTLKFDHFFSGRNLRISKSSVLKWCRGEGT